MRLGIDLGTTRTIVAAADRGNFPVVGFTTDEGDLAEYYPTVSAEVGGRLVHGWAAEAAEKRGAPTLRSWKRRLGELDAIRIGAVEMSPVHLVTDFLRSLAADLATSSNIAKTLTAPLEAVVSVPANAHSTQRFVTLEGFRAAGFEVFLVLNEPSAAGIEYAHRHHATLSSRREHVVVYDLGGGTFDVALVRMTPDHHDVVATGGVSRLGGDDFDALLLAMALETAGIAVPTDANVLAGLIAECRTAKEALLPQTRKIALDLSALGPNAPDKPIVLSVGEYYEQLRPLVERTLEVMEPVLAADDTSEEASSDESIAGIYMVGGASGLPAVPRIVRERFGRRVHRSPHPAAATAIGLAILAAGAHPPAVGEKFTRHFGVFRESNRGQAVTFDGIFEKGTPMPEPGQAPLTATRRYRAVHNVGHFRFIESGDLDASGQPTGDLTPHGDIRFPFGAEVTPATPLDAIAVQRLDADGPEVEERYEVDAAGIIAVTITDVERGRSERYVL